MSSVGLIESNADPCLFVRKTKTSKLIVVIYVDDGLVAGTDETEIEEFLNGLKTEFKITASTARSSYFTKKHMQEKFLNNLE